MPDTPRQATIAYAIPLIASAAMVVVLLPFWKAIFWAIVLGILCWPLRQKLVAWLRGRTTLASLLIVILVLAFVLVPGLLIGGLVVDGASQIVSKIESGTLEPGKFLETIPAHFPNQSEILKTIGVDVETLRGLLQQGFTSTAQYALTHIAHVGHGISLLALQTFLALYVLFAILNHGDAMFRALQNSLPMAEHSKDRFFAAFSEMSVATIKGMVSVGIVQGILGGGIFWFAGIENPIFWGALMGLLSVVPPFGAGFIWGPAGVVMALQGDMFHGLLILAFGAGVISTSDNVIRPIVVGGASSIPGYMVLVTTLGGLAMFGLTGLVLGPVIASLFVVAWQLVKEMNQGDGASADHGGLVASRDDEG